MFRQPLSENEVIRATKSAEKVYKEQNKDYKYKNETLINLLEIIDEEQKEMKTIISKDEYKRRNNEYNKKKYNSERAKEKYRNQLKKRGKLLEKEKISQRRIRIKDLLNKGLKQKDIYSKLNISVVSFTVLKQRYLNNMKLYFNTFILNCMIECYIDTFANTERYTLLIQIYNII